MRELSRELCEAINIVLRMCVYEGIPVSIVLHSKGMVQVVGNALHPEHTRQLLLQGLWSTLSCEQEESAPLDTLS